jgi:ATP-dependent Lon protease
MLDSTQNDSFQDKYFSGIDIDMSKVLFIFSYNDPEQIDRILLDRIHRIKFNNLTVPEKTVVVRNHLLPSLNTRLGFDNVVELSNEIIEYIIRTYTSEPGVRKLKEILFDLYSEINLDLLKYSSILPLRDEGESVSSSTSVALSSTLPDFDGYIYYNLPICVSRELLDTKYLSKYHKIEHTCIHASPQIGVINGLWANSLGHGGIIPIQTVWCPSTSFLDLQLTGRQGDVMRESMMVAKSVAWNLTDDDVKATCVQTCSATKNQGLHVHCPEGGVPKDGPSAGTAITVAIYSVLNKRPIRNDIAITGEINLQGQVTAIGGLDCKIMGGLEAGITTFLYPSANRRDFTDWLQKYESLKMNDMNDFVDLSGISFYEVSTIAEVFSYVFV